MREKVCYILGDGVQYSFLKKLGGLSSMVSEKLRQDTIVCYSSREEKTVGLPGIRSIAARLPVGVQAVFLSELDAQQYAWQTTHGTWKLPEPQRIFLLLETPCRKKSLAEMLTQLLRDHASVPVCLVLCRTGQVGLSTDQSNEEQALEEARQMAVQWKVECREYRMGTLPRWLYGAGAYTPEPYRKRLEECLKSSREELEEKRKGDVEFSLLLLLQMNLTDEEIALCYATPRPEFQGKPVVDLLWKNASQQLFAEESEHWQALWAYYCKNMLGELLLWDEKAEQQALRYALAEKMWEKRTHSSNPAIITSKTAEEYQRWLRKPSVRNELAKSTGELKQFVAADTVDNPIYAVLLEQWTARIDRMETLLNET